MAAIEAVNAQKFSLSNNSSLEAARRLDSTGILERVAQFLFVKNSEIAGTSSIVTEERFPNLATLGRMPQGEDLPVLGKFHLNRVNTLEILGKLEQVLFTSGAIAAAIYSYSTR
jgi:hypothetical protein